MGKKLTIVTQKGGVGKTNISTNLAGIYSKKGKVLLIDVDSQGNAAQAFGIDADEYKKTLYHVLTDDVSFQDAIYPIHKNIDILPSNDDMAFFEIEILTNIHKYDNPFYIMRDRLAGIENYYDFIIMDSPTNLGVLHGNILCYSNNVIIPFHPEPYSVRSLLKMIKSIRSFRENHNQNLRITGALPSIVESRTKTHRNILKTTKQVCDISNIKLFENMIPKSAKFTKAVVDKDLPATLAFKKDKISKIVYDLEKEISLV